MYVFIVLVQLTAYWGIAFHSAYDMFSWYILGSPNPKKWLSFGFVGIFEYIILPMLIIFLSMCPNLYRWMPSL